MEDYRTQTWKGLSLTAHSVVNAFNGVTKSDLGVQGRKKRTKNIEYTVEGGVVELT